MANILRLTYLSLNNIPNVRIKGYMYCIVITWLYITSPLNAVLSF